MIFYDETGVNPLPAGILVSIYPATGVQTLVASGWTQPGGEVAFTLANAANYNGVFVGRQAPPNQAVVGGASFSCQDYRSPSLSQAGYVAEQASLLPAAWWNPTDLVAGGVTYPVLFGNAAILASLDALAQYELAKMRLQSSSGSDIDAWARDFLGSSLPRFFNEADAVYIGRIEAALASEKCTIAAIQAAVLAFYAAIAPEMALAEVPNIAYDTGQGGYDTGRGGYDTVFTAPSAASVIPDILVWDRMTQPTLAAQYGVSEPEFVVQIGFKDVEGWAWYLDKSYLDNDTFLIASAASGSLVTVAPDPRLGALVGLMKSAGTQPLYLITQEA